MVEIFQGRHAVKSIIMEKHSSPTLLKKTSHQQPKTCRTEGNMWNKLIVTSMDIKRDPMTAWTWQLEHEEFTEKDSRWLTIGSSLPQPPQPHSPTDVPLWSIFPPDRGAWKWRQKPASPNLTVLPVWFMDSWKLETTWSKKIYIIDQNRSKLILEYIRTPCAYGNTMEYQLGNSLRHLFL